jgi:HSP20 family protein
MTIERWEPFRDMISLREALNSLLAESFVRQGGPPSTGGATMLPLDVAETEGEFVIKASLPGIKPEDVHITVYGDTLTIRGESKAEEEKKGTHWHVRERRVSSFARSLSLGAPIHADAASAHFAHGVLTLTLPKTAEAKPKQIKVAGGPTPPPSSDRPDRPDQERDTSGTGKHDPAPPPSKPGGKPEPTRYAAAEQALEAHEAETARNAVASNRERMVDIGRGDQQAGRQGQ